METYVTKAQLITSLGIDQLRVQLFYTSQNLEDGAECPSNTNALVFLVAGPLSEITKGLPAFSLLISIQNGTYQFEDSKNFRNYMSGNKMKTK
jgi:hypothetical protein